MKGNRPNKVYLYVFDTMADWEIGYLTAELNSGRFFRKGLAPYKAVAVGVTKDSVKTMGGLSIIPQLELSMCNSGETAALILPGGETWMEAMHDPVLDMAEQYIEEGIVVAAICGATAGLARKGLLNTKQHTSNSMEYLKAVCSAYTGENKYCSEPAVTCDNLITAAGTASLEFTSHVLRAMEVYTAETLEAWYKLYKTGESRYFFELMASVQQ